MESLKLTLLSLHVCLLITISPASSEDTKPYPDRNRLFDEEFVWRLNKVETLEVNKIIMDEFEIFCLYTSDVTCNNDVKQSALIKFESKMKSLLCLNAWIVLHKLSKRFVDVNDLSVFLKRMISVFYSARYAVPSWFWHIYIHTMTYLKTVWSFVVLFSVNFKKHIVNLAGILENMLLFCRQCQTFGYLDTKVDPDPSVCIQTGINVDYYLTNCAKQLCEHFQLSGVIGQERLFDPEYLKLTHFSKHHDYLISGNDHLDWTNAQAKLTSEYNRMVKASEIDGWRKDPFSYVDHQITIAKIIQAKMLYYTWCNLSTFNKKVAPTVKPVIVIKSNQIESNEDGLWFHLRKPLDLAVDFLNIYDGPLWHLNYLMNSDKPFTYDTLDSISRAIESRVQHLFEELNVKSKNSRDVFHTSYYPTESNDDVNSSSIHRYNQDQINSAEKINEYLLKTKSYLEPVDFYFILFFVAGKDNKTPLTI